MANLCCRVAKLDTPFVHTAWSFNVFLFVVPSGDISSAYRTRCLAINYTLFFNYLKNLHLDRVYFPKGFIQCNKMESYSNKVIMYFSKKKK